MEPKTLFEIPVSEISPNPHNPRLIFNQEELDELKGSIKKVGILVPLTVYQNTKKFPKTQYVLLDGERRWRCAKELNLAKVPANVIDEPKDVTQNILFMFNIHHYRREWELFPTALKLEQLIKELETDQESVLSNFTGVSRSMIRRCKTLLWFPKKYREVLMERDGKVSTDFFIEIFPIVHRLSYEDDYSFPDGVIKLTDGLIGKFVAGQAITDVKEFRELRRSLGYWDRKGNIGEFKNQLRHFMNVPNADLSIFVVPQENEKSITALLKHVGFLNSILDESNVDALSDVHVVDQLKRLFRKIKSFLDELE